MSNNRPIKVAEAVRREMGDLLLKGIKDIRLQNTLVSVTDVQVTKDLRNVSIFVSVLGDAEKKKTVMQGLDSARGFIRGEIGKRINLRFMPDIVVKLDESLEKGNKLITLMDKIKKEETITNEPEVIVETEEVSI